jgi:hypothetical protein
VHVGGGDVTVVCAASLVMGGALLLELSVRHQLESWERVFRGCVVTPAEEES